MKAQKIPTDAALYTQLLRLLKPNDFRLYSHEIRCRIEEDNIQMTEALLCSLIRQYGRLGDLPQVSDVHSLFNQKVTIASNHLSVRGTHEIV